jgi:hypothetical protein
MTTSPGPLDDRTSSSAEAQAPFTSAPLPPPPPVPAPSATPSQAATPSPAPSMEPALGASTVPPAKFDVTEPTSPFAPLRTAPPPQIFATWWLRYLLFLAQLVGIAVVLLAEYAGDFGELGRSSTIVMPYLLCAVLLVSWSALAMTDAARLVPATAYRRRSSAALVVVLWLLAFAAPVAAARVVGWARDRFAVDPDDLAVVAVTVAAVFVCFLVVWMPFRYHTQQAHRIGAPGRVVAAWFWLPLLTVVGALLINALGMRDTLAENGMTDVERTVQVGVLFGLPALVFALATWRATTVFDEVIDLRWRRWRSEWEQTLLAMTMQPPPGPEAPTAPPRS